MEIIYIFNFPKYFCHDEAFTKVMRTCTSIMNGQCECHVTLQLASTVWVPASATMLLLLLAAACHCSLPTPDPSTDPAMATHLQKMWDGCVSYCQLSLLSLFSSGTTRRWPSGGSSSPRWTPAPTPTSSSSMTAPSRTTSLISMQF